MKATDMNQMKVGEFWRYVGQEYRGGHEHWEWVEGQVYEIFKGNEDSAFCSGKVGPRNGNGCVPSQNWGKWVWEKVSPTDLNTILPNRQYEVVACLGDEFGGQHSWWGFPKGAIVTSSEVGTIRDTSGSHLHVNYANWVFELKGKNFKGAQA